MLQERGKRGPTPRRPRKKRATRKPAPTPAWAQPLKTQAQPFRVQKRAARQKTKRAARKIPADPQLARVLGMGYTPVIADERAGPPSPPRPLTAAETKKVYRRLAVARRRAGVKSNRALYELLNLDERRAFRDIGAAVQRSNEARGIINRPEDEYRSPTRAQATDVEIAGIPLEALGEELARRAGPQGRALAAPAVVAFNLGRATVEDPISVGKSSVRTAVESVAGIPQGVKALVENPGGALDAIARDYEDRYGDILDNPKQFREKVKTEYGLTPYMLDAAMLAPPVGSTAGAVARLPATSRAITALERTRLPGTRVLARAGREAVKTATMERPALRFSGGEGGVKAQRTSRNLITATGQRALDARRARVYRNRVQRAGLRETPDGRLVRAGRETPGRMPALRPGRGEVVPTRNLRDLPLLRRNTGRVARDIGGMQSVTRIKLLTQRGQTLEKVDKALRKLTDDQQQVLKYYVQLGLPADRAAAERLLTQRLAQMTRARRDSGYRVAPILESSNDEVALLRTVLREPDRYLAPEIRTVADDLVQIQRATESADPGLNETTALVNRYRGQAGLLGVRRGGTEPQDPLPGIDVPAAATTVGRVADLEPADEFVTRVQKAADDAGLAEPGYWMSNIRPEAATSLAATGRGLRAAHRNRQYKGTLFDVGAEQHTPDVLTRGIERNIKRRFQWALVIRNLNTHAFEWSRGRNGQGMRLSEVKRYLDTHQIDPASISLVDAKIAQRRDNIPEGQQRGTVVDDAEGTDAQLVDDLAEDPVAEFQRDWQASYRQWRDITDADIRGDARFMVVPREVGETLDGLANSLDSTGFRALEVILKQKPARIMLGAFNVPWLTFQIASNSMLTGLGGGKNPLDIYGAHKWWRGLDPDEKLAVEAELGITHGHHFAMDQPNLGATNNRLVNFWRAYKKSRVGRLAHKGNPLDLMFRADEAQNNFFRKVLFYNQAKRAAYDRMGANWKSIDGIQKKLTATLGLPPERLGGEIAKQGVLFEQHARHVADFLGDYLRFTPSERFLLQRNVMFYGYLRFSLRFVFYTMPVQHPVMTGILGNIGRMGAQEIKTLFGVPSSYRLPTNALANVYTGEQDERTGMIGSLPLGRMNPALNAITQLESEQQLVGLVSPIYQALADQFFEESSFTGRDWKILGQATPAEAQRPKNYYGSIFGAAIPGRPRNRILLRDLLSLAAPYRIAEKTGIPGTGVEPLEGPQGDDSLLFDPRPIEYRDEELRRKIRRSIHAERERREGTGALKSALLPIVMPQQTAIVEAIDREREKEADAADRAMGRRKRRRRSTANRYGGDGGGNPYGGTKSTTAARYGG